MTAATAHTPKTGTKEEPPGVTSSAPPPLRLSLTPAGSTPARIDGAWWPHSRDLTAEIPALTDVLDEQWDRVTRITVNPAHWPVIPHKVQVNGHVVKVGWFKEQDMHQVMLLSYRTARRDLLVIPPETRADTAAWLMAAAADPLRTSTGSQLREEAERLTAEGSDGIDGADGGQLAAA